MKRSNTILAAALVAFAAITTAASAAQTEMQMVEDTAARLLIELGIDSMKVEDLTVAQLREIIFVADSHEMGDGARAKVLKIINAK